MCRHPPSKAKTPNTRIKPRLFLLFGILSLFYILFSTIIALLLVDNDKRTEWISSTVLEKGGTNDENVMQSVNTNELSSKYDNNNNNSNNIDNKIMITTNNTSPNPKKIATKNIEMSACLLLKDENHNLIEWIAYHYITLPLRYLVVAVDPNSVSSPSDILDRYRNSTMSMDIEIVEWKDDDYLPLRLQGSLPWSASAKDHITRHHQRQNWFLTKCMQYHKQINEATWTLLVDVDEFVSFNTIDEDDVFPYYYLPNTSSNDYTVNQTFISLDQDSLKYAPYLQARIRLPTSSKTTSASSASRTMTTIADYIEKEEDNIPWKNRACIILPRLAFGNYEEHNKSTLNQSITTTNTKLPFNPMKFNTLRFLHHATKGNITQNKRGKPIIDVSRIPLSRLEHRPATYPHCPLRQCGTSEYARHDFALLRVNHYALSREAYFAQSNKRRTVKMYEARGADVNNGVSYDMQPWLKQFVHKVGVENAIILLQGVGDVDTRHLKRPDDMTSSDLF